MTRRRYAWEDGPLDDELEEARFRDHIERIDAAIYADEVLRPRYEAARLGKPYAPDDRKAVDKRHEDDARYYGEQP